MLKIFIGSENDKEFLTDCISKGNFHIMKRVFYTLVYCLQKF